MLGMAFCGNEGQKYSWIWSRISLLQVLLIISYLVETPALQISTLKMRDQKKIRINKCSNPLKMSGNVVFELKEPDLPNRPHLDGFLLRKPKKVLNPHGLIPVLQSDGASDLEVRVWLLTRRKIRIITFQVELKALWGRKTSQLLSLKHPYGIHC